MNHRSSIVSMPLHARQKRSSDSSLQHRKIRTVGPDIAREQQVEDDGILEREVTEEQLFNRNAEFRKRCLTWKGKLGRMELCFNPLSTISAAVLVWLVIVWSLVDVQSISHFKEAQQWITEKCTWIYVATQAVWTGALIVIYFKFGHLKLGLPSDIPEYSDFDYFAMIFTTGICNGILYVSASEPISLYANSTGDALNYWGKDGEGVRAQNAINIMFYHWGFHGFSVYLIPGLLIAALAYRKGLPLTMRTCFYPVFGKKIFGRAGDVVDSLFIICITFGVSTSFMIGSVLLIVGLHKLIPAVKDTETNYVIATWAITLMATVSAVSGLKLGIRRMSQLCFLSGVLFFVVIALSDDIWFLLNLMVQSVGYYFQYIIGMSGYTAAFEQKRNIPNQLEKESNWMHDYTIFYWGWWLGWAPLVSMFIARLSKGRYIKDVINYAFFLPIFVTFVWIVGMGGLAINMEMEARMSNLTCNGIGRLDGVSRLQCVPENEIFFVLMDKYEDISGFLKILALAIVVFYYVTSFDTAALVIDSISSNGETNPPIAQRIFWCLTVGATTTALVYYEAGNGFDQVYAFAVICGLPCTIALCIITMALWRLLKKEPGWRYELDVQWEMFYGNVNSLMLLKKVVLAVFVPWYFLGDIVICKNNVKKMHERIFIFIKFATPFFLWIVLMVLKVRYKNVDNIGWAVLCGLIVYSSMLRRKMRERYNIEGNIFEDACLMLFYPLTIIQMHVQKDVGTDEIQQNTQSGGNDNLGHEYEEVLDDLEKHEVVPDIQKTLPSLPYRQVPTGHPSLPDIAYVKEKNTSIDAFDV